MTTHVVNVNDYRPLTSRPYLPFIYVGRYMPGLFKGHPLGNPFKVGRKAKQSERLACLELYRDWLLQPEREGMLRALAENVRRTNLPLGCWCKPKECHGDVLAEYVDLILARSAS